MWWVQKTFYSKGICVIHFSVYVRRCTITTKYRWEKSNQRVKSSDGLLRDHVCMATNAGRRRYTSPEPAWLGGKPVWRLPTWNLENTNETLLIGGLRLYIDTFIYFKGYIYSKQGYICTNEGTFIIYYFVRCIYIYGNRGAAGTYTYYYTNLPSKINKIPSLFVIIIRSYTLIIII